MCRGRDSESDTSDVIICSSEKLESEPEIESDPEDSSQLQSNFLELFQLTAATDPLDVQMDQKPSTMPKRNGVHHSSHKKSSNKKSARQLDVPLQPDKARRHPRRANVAVMLSKCPQIPLSSPAGQCVIKTTKVSLADNYQRERIERYERFCAATVLATDGSNRPKFMDRPPSAYPASTFRPVHPKTKKMHTYKFPRRQFRRHLRDADVAKYQRILLQENKCRPLTVRAKQLTQEEIESLQANVKRQKILPPQTIVDYIDLCSEPDEDVMPLKPSTSSFTPQSNMQLLEPVRPMQLMRAAPLPPPPSTPNRMGPLNSQITTITKRTISHIQASRNYPVFVDCSIVNESITQTIQTDTIFQSLITNSEPIRYGGNELQQNKENRVMQFITDQTNAQATMIASVNPFSVDFTS